MHHLDRTLLAAAVASLALPALAIDFKPADGVDASVAGTVTFGTMVRSQSPDPDAYPYITSTVVAGTQPGHLVGLTGSSDLNFEKNKPVSTVLKGNFDLDVHGATLGAHARVMAWHDFALENEDRPYGNYPNGYRAGAPLGDEGFAPEAKFSNVLLRDAYLWGRFAVQGDGQLRAALGRQSLGWGVAALTQGGINAAVDAADLAAAARPGALPAEGRIPAGMLALNLNASPAWGLDGFVKYEFRNTVPGGCGTFFDFSSTIPQGCNLAGVIGTPIPPALPTVASLSEPALLNSGYYVHRIADSKPSAAGQWGLSLRMHADSLATDLRAYAVNYRSPLPAYRVRVEDIGGATSAPGAAGALQKLGDPNGLKYSLVYADDVHLVGTSFDTRPDPGTRYYGELAVRTNAPINWNGNDLLNAALLRAPNSLLNLAHGVNAVPAGGSYDAYDRRPVATLALGTQKAFSGVLGAQRMALAAELGWSHVNGLPDRSVMRYGRGFQYGSAPYLVNGTLTACSEAITPSGAPAGVAGKTCRVDGFVTRDAWGMRLNVSASYPDAFFGATLVPALFAAHDVSGYSYDGTFSQGRTTLRPSVRADWGGRYYAEVAYTAFAGGSYNLFIDKSNLALVGGARF